MYKVESPGGRVESRYGMESFTYHLGKANYLSRDVQVLIAETGSIWAPLSEVLQAYDRQRATTLDFTDMYHYVQDPSQKSCTGKLRVLVHQDHVYIHFMDLWLLEAEYYRKTRCTPV